MVNGGIFKTCFFAFIGVSHAKLLGTGFLAFFFFIFHRNLQSPA